MKKLFYVFLLLCAPLASAQVLCPSGYSFNGICWNNPQGNAIMGGQSGTGTAGKGGSITIAPGVPTGTSTAVGDFVVQMDPTNPAVNFTCTNPTQGGVNTASCSFNGMSPSTGLPSIANNTVLGNTSGIAATPSALPFGGVLPQRVQPNSIGLGVLALPALVTPTISAVSITGVGGQFACTCTGLVVGDVITITGAYGGTGSITGYVSGNTYYVSATNGTSTFTLQSIALTANPPAAIVTTAGTPTGLTYTPAAQGDFNAAFGNSAMAALTTSTYNTAVGYQALMSLTAVTGQGAFDANTAIGAQALMSATAGASSNTAIGMFSMANLLTGIGNTAVGQASLASATVGSQNTAIGATALGFNTTGINNTAVGYNSLENNITGNSNVAVGSGALTTATTSTNNTAVGFNALNKLTVATGNVAIGHQALTNTTTGGTNIAVGVDALKANTTGATNTAVGNVALTAETTGTGNVALGNSALKALTTGSNNVGIGLGAGFATLTTGSGNILIGDGTACDTAAGATSNTIQICGTSTSVWSATGTNVPATSATTIAGSLTVNGAQVSGGTTFTLGAGTGACATTSTLVGGSTTGSFLCTGTAGASTQVINLPTAPNGWACHASDMTSGVAGAQSTVATNSATIKITIATTSDKVIFSCSGY